MQFHDFLKITCGAAAVLFLSLSIIGKAEPNPTAQQRPSPPARPAPAMPSLPVPVRPSPGNPQKPPARPAPAKPVPERPSPPSPVKPPRPPNPNVPSPDAPLNFPNAVFFVKYKSISHSFAASLRNGGYTFTPGPGVNWANFRGKNGSDYYAVSINEDGRISEGGVWFCGDSMTVFEDEDLLIQIL